MKTYLGDRTIDGVVVTVDGAELPTHAEAKQFTDAMFEWGFDGAAATQLAFAILYDHTGDAARAGALAPGFMRAVTANFGNEWELTSADVETAIARLDAPVAR